MFVDDGRGWGRPSEPAPKPALTPRQERVILNLIFLVVALTLIAPIGGGTIVEGFVALFTTLR